MSIQFMLLSLSVSIFLLVYNIVQDNKKRNIFIEINNFDTNVHNIKKYFLFEICFANYCWNEEIILFLERVNSELDTKFESMRHSKLNDVYFISVWFSEPYKHYDSISEMIDLLPLKKEDCEKLISLDVFIKTYGKKKFELIEVEKGKSYLPLTSQIENVYRFVKFLNTCDVKYKPDEFPKLTMLKYELNLNVDLTDV